MFGENLRILRKEKGLSQEELASRLHVVRQTISKWEKGVSVPDAELLVCLSEILETPVSVLLGDSVEPSTESSVIGQQLEQINAALAEKNRRSKFIWRVVGISLLTFLVLCIFLVIVGMISFGHYSSDRETVIEEVQMAEQSLT